MHKLNCRTSLIILSLLVSVTFKAQAAEQFIAAFTDPSNGLTWSKALSGTYSNGCVDTHDNYDSSKCTSEIDPDGRHQVKVYDSNAAKACHDIGARLPNKLEIESLIRNFDNTEYSYGPRLTAKGRVEMRAKLGDGMHKWFWSSSVSSLNNGNAVGFDLYPLMGFVVYDYRSIKRSVLCVLDQ